MDIEKLIERLRSHRGAFFEALYKQDMDDAATALSTLQAENKRLNKIICSIPTAPDSGRTISQYDKEMSMCAYLDDLEDENEKLRAELEQVKEKNAGLALALLTECAPNPDCLGSDEWRVIRTELEQVKRERDAAVDCIYQIEDDLNRGSDNDWAREHISEWESQKED